MTAARNVQQCALGEAFDTRAVTGEQPALLLEIGQNHARRATAWAALEVRLESQPVAARERRVARALDEIALAFTRVHDSTSNKSSRA
jgi:hypothetical protein